jgi:hypothetical protein
LLFVAIVLDANEAPARKVPRFVVAVLTNPMFWMFADAVKNESELLKAATN